MFEYARSMGNGVGQKGAEPDVGAPSDSGPSFGLLLLSGFAIAAGAGIFQALVWSFKKIAEGKQKSPAAEEAHTEETS